MLRCDRAAQARFRQHRAHSLRTLADHRLEVDVVDQLQAVVEALKEGQSAGGVIREVRVVRPRCGHEAGERVVTLLPVHKHIRRHGAHVRCSGGEQTAALGVGAEVAAVVEQHLHRQQALDRHVGAPDARGERGVVLAGSDQLGDRFAHLVACLGPEIEAKAAHPGSRTDRSAGAGPPSTRPSRRESPRGGARGPRRSPRRRMSPRPQQRHPLPWPAARSAAARGSRPRRH